MVGGSEASAWADPIGICHRGVGYSSPFS
jgi:hypothetical protein